MENININILDIIHYFIYKCPVGFADLDILVSELFICVNPSVFMGREP